MFRLVDHILEKIPFDCFTDQELMHLIQGTDHQRYGLVKRALKKGELVKVRRGLYCLAARYRRKLLTDFELAYRIYGPSYISLESALSYHGLIPEAVRTVTSVCVKRSREFNTPFGLFSFKRLPVHNFYVGVRSLVERGKPLFFLANPWKALLDYVYVSREKWTSLEPLFQSLRIEREEMPQIADAIDREELQAFKAYYHHQRISKLIFQIEREFSNERPNHSRAA